MRRETTDLEARSTVTGHGIQSASDHDVEDPTSYPKAHSSSHAMSISSDCDCSSDSALESNGKSAACIRF